MIHVLKCLRFVGLEWVFTAKYCVQARPKRPGGSSGSGSGERSPNAVEPPVIGPPRSNTEGAAPHHRVRGEFAAENASKGLMITLQLYSSHRNLSHFASAQKRSHDPKRGGPAAFAQRATSAAPSPAHHRYILDICARFLTCVTKRRIPPFPN